MIATPTLWSLVEQRADATPDAVMATDETGRQITFAGYRDAAERVAAGLAALGLAESNNVSWALPTWIESMVLAGALARLGAVQNPLLPIYRGREVGFITAQTGARLLIVPSAWRGFDYRAMADEVAAGQPGLEVLVVESGAGRRQLPEGDPSTLAPVPRSYQRPGDFPVRWLYYTSGTTADPKGTKHTDATLLATAEAMISALELEADDCFPVVFPLTHIAGSTYLFSSMLTGCSYLFVEMFDPATTIPLLVERGVTLAGAGTAFHLAYLAAQRQLAVQAPGSRLFPRVRAFPGGGAPKPPQLHFDIKAEMGGVGIVSGYGLTECPILAMNSVRDPDDKLAFTEGRATPGVAIKVVRLGGGAAGPGEPGEIRVNGPQLFRGYVDPSLDADAFDEEGFFGTGDLGFLDADGFVTITGRLKDIIIRKGENISAKEIEDVLYQHPKVRDVAVIGLPDGDRGERACAVVACQQPADPLTFSEMVAFLNAKRLMVQKIPEQLEIVIDVPRNPTGKILKHTLREQYAAPGSPGGQLADEGRR